MIPWLIVAALITVLLIWLISRLLDVCEAASPANWGSRGKNRLAGLVRLFCRHVHGLRSAPLPLPAQGPVVVASNHISGLDPLLLIASSPRPLRFLIAREQYQRFGLNWVFRLAGCIPVDRESRPDRALREALRALESGEALAVFPHGRIHLDTDPPRRLKGGAVHLAQRTRAPICPVRIDDVRGAGHTILAVLIPTTARLQAYPLLVCQERDPQICLQELATMLETPQPME